MTQPLDRHALKPVRLIATDMDGTLTQQGKFTPKFLQALNDLAAANLPVLIVTGRSAGWVQAIEHYLPVVGAIAENGGLFYGAAGQRNGKESAGELLVSIADVTEHRQALAEMFAQLQSEFPRICESVDNRFRITDWTFDVEGLSTAELQHMEARCHAAGWGFTFSTVQCHIKKLEQEKAIGLTKVLTRYFPQYSARQIITVGDSPNDESLFDASVFPVSIGVANVRHYLDRLDHKPAFITETAEAEGFCELARCLLEQVKLA